MKKLLIFGFLLLFFNLLTGCAIGTGPQNEREAFPIYDQDPRVGLIINQGTAHLNLFIYNEAGRLVEKIYLTGADRYSKINGQNIPEYWVKPLEAGRYRVEIYPFYYRTNIINPLFGKPGRYRIDLYKQTAQIHVSKKPNGYYYGGRYWPWILNLNGGDIPDTAHGLPGIQFNFRGEAWNLISGK